MQRQIYGGVFRNNQRGYCTNLIEKYSGDTEIYFFWSSFQIYKMYFCPLLDAIFTWTKVFYFILKSASRLFSSKVLFLNHLAFSFRRWCGINYTHPVQTGASLWHWNICPPALQVLQESQYCICRNSHAREKWWIWLHDLRRLIYYFIILYYVKQCYIILY